MKKSLKDYILLSVYCLSPDLVLHAHKNVHLIFDPVSDFRSPHSLTELLHEGLIEVESLIFDELYGDAQLILRSLSDSYDSMINQSNIHVVYRDDREFLQNLIDRIDNMIKDLESSNRLLALDLSILHKNIDLLYVLRNRIIAA